MKIPELLKSKKAQAFIIGVLLVLLKDVLELEPDQIKMIVGLVATYIFGQGVADHGKEKAKIENGAETV